MTRSILLVALLLPIAILSPARAQSHAADNIINGAPLDYPSNEPYNPRRAQNPRNATEHLRPLPTYDPPAGWAAARTPNPNYPLRITLDVILQDSVGRAIQGDGTVRIESAHPASLNFHYACVLALARDTAYEARWINPNRKLEVLLVDPQGRHATCRLSTLAT